MLLGQCLDSLSNGPLPNSLPTLDIPTRAVSRPYRHSGLPCMLGQSRWVLHIKFRREVEDISRCKQDKVWTVFVLRQKVVQKEYIWTRSFPNVKIMNENIFITSILVTVQVTKNTILSPFQFKIYNETVTKYILKNI